MGLRPWFGLALKLCQRPNERHSRIFFSQVAGEASLAAHPTAKPERKYFQAKRSDIVR